MKGLPKKILVTLLTVVALVLALPLAERVGVELPGFGIEAEAATYSGTCGTNVNWSLDTDTGVLSITGTGAMTNYSSSYVPWYSYRSSIKSVTIGNDVTSIGSSAFRGCTWLTSVTIGNGVKSIGYDAFFYCTGLTSITIPDSVESIGEYAFRDCKGLTSVTIGNSVTSIGDRAFYGCTGLTSVTIPDSVKTIGDSAFHYCTGLTSITVDENNPNYCSDEYGVLFDKAKTTLIQYPVGNTRTEYVIPNSVKSIGACAFEDCTGLTSVTIPGSVTSIGGSAFEDCTGLTKTNYTGTISQWCNISFGDYQSNPDYYSNPVYYSNNLYLNDVLVTDLVIPDSVTSIGSFAFGYCTGLTSVTIGNSVESIGDYAFSGCTGLTSVTIGNSVKSIGDDAFYYCTKLKTVNNYSSLVIDAGKTTYGYVACYADTVNWYYDDYEDSGELGNNVTYYFNSKTLTLTISGTGAIPDYSSASDVPWCSYRSTIKYIVIEAGITSIGNNAFYYCKGLTSVTIGNSVESIGDAAFYCCYGLTSVTIGNSVTSIGEAAFYDCYGLTSVTIPNSVTSIGEGAFYDCYGLTSVTIGNGVTNIPAYAFFYCIGLTSITIPDSVESIGEGAFAYCFNLKNVVLNSKLKYIGEAAFVITSLERVNIPASVETIGDLAFAANLYSLKEITVDENNPNYSSENGVLFNKDKTVLIQYPIGTSAEKYELPESVNSISAYAFASIISFDELKETVNQGEINLNNIPDAPSLKEIHIGKSLKSIEDGAFECLTSLTDVYYEGTEEEWAAITIGDYNSPILNATMHFNAEKCTHPATRVVRFDPTCTVPGFEYTVCDDCSTTLTDMIILPAAHKWGEWVQVKAPKIGINGSEERVCSACSEKETRAIPMLGESVEDENTGIIITYSDDAYDNDIEVVVEEQFDGSSFIISGSSEQKQFDITTIINGEEVQPNKPIIVRIPLPEGFDQYKTYVYHVDVTKGKLENMNCWYEDGYLVFEATHFSIYCVAQMEKIDLVSIEIETVPSTINYSYKAVTSTNGLKVIAHYSDETSKDITDKVEITGFDANSTGTKTATVKYNDLTATFEYTVKYTWWQWIIRILLLGIFWY